MVADGRRKLRVLAEAPFPLGIEERGQATLRRRARGLAGLTRTRRLDLPASETCSRNHDHQHCRSHAHPFASPDGLLAARPEAYPIYRDRRSATRGTAALFGRARSPNAAERGPGSESRPYPPTFTGHRAAETV